MVGPVRRARQYRNGSKGCQTTLPSRHRRRRSVDAVHTAAVATGAVSPCGDARGGGGSGWNGTCVVSEPPQPGSCPKPPQPSSPRPTEHHRSPTGAGRQPAPVPALGPKSPRRRSPSGRSPVRAAGPPPSRPRLPKDARRISLTPVGRARRLPHSFCVMHAGPYGVAFPARPAVLCPGKPMTRTDQWKLAGVLLATGLAIFYLFPSFRFYSLTPAQRAALPAAELSDLRKKAIHLGLDLQGGMHLVLEVDKSKLSAAEAKDAVDRAMEVLRRRVDEFGVAEPLIQREGEDRIAVQLPGLTDRQRAMDLIGKTA
ncbi:MAG: hypothetical protein E6K81_14240, partial [Candidatus Eisenbacteria bacterium]